jgi:hypothetical protein
MKTTLEILKCQEDLVLSATVVITGIRKSKETVIHPVENV